MTGEQRYPITMTVAQWWRVDGSTDNEIDGELVDGDPRGIVDLASSIREAAWQVLDSQGLSQWPPGDEPITVTLSAEQWALACEIVDHWSKVGHRDDVTTRQVRDLISETMAETPGWADLRARFWD